MWCFVKWQESKSEILQFSLEQKMTLILKTSRNKAVFLSSFTNEKRASQREQLLRTFTKGLTNLHWKPPCSSMAPINTGLGDIYVSE